MEEKNNSFLEIIKFALITLIIIVPIRTFIAQPFIVSGESMVPTFEDGEYLIIDELSYYFETPKRGEVVVFHYPKDPSKYFIKRVIGLPGETVKIEKEKITITDGDKTIELAEPYIKNSGFNNLAVTLNDQEYFVMGDNRPASSDSRIWGPVSEDLIKGRVLFRLLPVARASVNPGDFSN